MSKKTKEELLQEMSDLVMNMEDELIIDKAMEYVESGYSINDGIMKGLVDGMNRASELYDEEEYYIAELLLCSDAMYNGINVLKEHLSHSEESIIDEKTKVVIGVIKGDTHDIGKNLVKIMLDTAGYEIIDLGRDVSVDDFVKAVKENNAKILCMSSLMTTTMYTMRDVVDKLVEEGIRESVKIMVGGGPITEEFCKEIGADAYSKNAVEAVKVAKSLIC